MAKHARLEVGAQILIFRRFACGSCVHVERVANVVCARKDELEKNYYAELERSRAALDKLRAELEGKLAAKFRELDEEKNRLAAERTDKGANG